MNGKSSFKSASSSTDIFGDLFMKALESLSENGVEIITDSTPQNIPINIATFVKDMVGNNLGSSSKQGSTTTSIPTQSFCAYDEIHDANNINLYFDIPGVKKQDVKLEISKKESEYVLTLTVSRVITKLGSDFKYRYERFYGVKSREVCLPLCIDTSSIAAKQDDGVLHVTIKKKVSNDIPVNIPIL